MQEIFLIRQDDRKPLRMKSSAKQENKVNFKRNIYIPKMCVDPGPGGLQQQHDAPQQTMLYSAVSSNAETLFYAVMTIFAQ